MLGLVSAGPLSRPLHGSRKWWVVAASVAASVALALSVAVSLALTESKAVPWDTVFSVVGAALTVAAGGHALARILNDTALTASRTWPSRWG